MSRLMDKKQVNTLVWFCALVYFVSYVSRINLSAVLVEVIGSGFAEKHSAALALTACSITYGAGQIISGWLGDRFRPQNVIFTGFLITSAVNLCVGMLPDGTWLVPLWAVNGFAQAFMWPPLVRILSTSLTPEDYKKGCVKVSWGSSFGTIAVYLAAPVLITAASFRSVFWCSGLLAVIMAVLWKVLFERVAPGENEADGRNDAAQSAPADMQNPPRLGSFALVLLLFIMLAIVLQGMLRDGVTNWMPTLISDTFHLDSSISILTGVVLPIFSILTFQLASWVNRVLLKNEVVCAGAFFLLGCLSALLLALFGDRSVLLSLLLLALLVGSMHGVNLILVCMVPPFFAKYGRVSLISGVINSCTYVGSAVSTYGVAVFTDAFGWTSAIWLWAAIALAGTLICIGLCRGWGRFREM